MKRTLSMLCLLAILTGVLTACGASAQNPVGGSGPLYSNLTDVDSQEETSALLSKAGISDPAIETFLSLVRDYNALMGTQPYFQDGFNPLPEGGIDAAYDNVDTYSLWTGKRDYADANCRITAFGLLRNQITAGAPKTPDDFLFTDKDALENYTLCGLSQKEQGAFYALFNPVSVKATTDTQAVLDAVLAEWKTRGITFREGDAKLISVVFNSELDDIAYVGHTGVLVPDGDGWLFVEKYAPAYPYQATKYQTKDQLKDALMARLGGQYTEGVTAKPFLLENDHAF